MIKTALALAGRGLPVFPCVPRGKKPATAHGCKDATIDADVIRRWWGRSPPERGSRDWRRLENVRRSISTASTPSASCASSRPSMVSCRPAVEVITARGRHIWFRYPDRPVKNTAGKIAPGIDTDGGRRLCAGAADAASERPRYVWSVDSATAIAAAPAWLVEKIAAPANDQRHAAADAAVARGASWSSRRRRGRARLHGGTAGRPPAAPADRSLRRARAPASVERRALHAAAAGG